MYILDTINLDFLSNLTEQQLGAGGVGLVVFSVVLAVVKGVIRLLLGIAGLVAGAVAFWFAFRNGDTLAAHFVEDPEPWMPLGIAGGAASGAYLGVRHGAGLLLKPLLGSVDALKHKKMVAAFLGLGMGGAGLYGGGSASHQVDAMNFLNEQRKGREVTWVNKLLAKTQESWFGNFQQHTDPSKTGYRCDVVKLLSLAKYKNNSLNTSEVEGILKNPELQALLRDSTISRALEDGDFQTLFRSEALSGFLKDEENKKFLQSVDWRKILGR